MYLYCLRAVPSLNMSEPETFPIDNPCFFYVDEESVSSRATYVERVCGALRSLEISDTDFALGANWVPPMPIAKIMERIVRPSMFVLQKLLDPWFGGSSSLPFAFSEQMHHLVQHALREILQLIVRFLFIFDWPVTLKDLRP